MANDEGLTRPLVNNIGGVIDQDAPSADQLLGDTGNKSWSDETVERSDLSWHDESRRNPNDVLAITDAMKPLPSRD